MHICATFHREKYAAATSAWTSSGFSGRRACARRAGANKSLSNCSLKNLAAIVPSGDGVRQRPLKPGPTCFISLNRPARANESRSPARQVCLLIFTAGVDRARRASTIRDASSLARILFEEVVFFPTTGNSLLHPSLRSLFLSIVGTAYVEYSCACRRVR